MKTSDNILGFVTVNDKGQVVIPADVRTVVGVRPGDKLLVMLHPSHEGIVLIKPDGLEEFAKRMLKQLNSVKNQKKAAND